MVRPRVSLALSDNAVGGCLQGAATKPSPGAGAPVGVSRTHRVDERRRRRAALPSLGFVKRAKALFLRF